MIPWVSMGRYHSPRSYSRYSTPGAPCRHHSADPSWMHEKPSRADTRFNMGLKAQEKADLVAFLRSL